MNSTLNYGYASSLDTIDHDIKHVEDKADANTATLAGQAERIIRNEEQIKCLSKQKCDSYSKCEADKLLDGKADKKDGFGLISDGCLDQICANKGDISLLEQYIKELQEQNAFLKEELADRAKSDSPVEYPIEHTDGVAAWLNSAYFKTDFNVVTINESARKADITEYFEHREITAHLPSGFRPARTIEIDGAVNCSDGKRGCTLYISAAGEIMVLLNGIKNASGVFFSASFLAAQ